MRSAPSGPRCIEVITRGIGNDDVRHRARSRLGTEARSGAASKIVKRFQRPVTPSGAGLSGLIEKALDIVAPFRQNAVQFRRRIVVERAGYRALLDVCAH
jgi:hypothetical protein